MSVNSPEMMNVHCLLLLAASHSTKCVVKYTVLEINSL